MKKNKYRLYILYSNFNVNKNLVNYTWVYENISKDNLIKFLIKERRRSLIYQEQSGFKVVNNLNYVPDIKVSWRYIDEYTCEYTYEKNVCCVSRVDKYGDEKFLDKDWVENEINLYLEKQRVGGWWYKKYHTSGEFRKDPVPHTSYCRWHRFHNPQVYRTARLNAIPEYKEFYKKKNDQNAWDLEKFEYCDKSWKRNCKCRHQWEKHLKNI